MARVPLPSRRPNLTTELEHGGFGFTVTVEFDLTGHPRGVFADGVKIGTDLGHVISDACVVISLALQHGCPAAALPKSLGRVPDPMAGAGGARPASVLGAIAAVIVGLAQPDPAAPPDQNRRSDG